MAAQNGLLNFIVCASGLTEKAQRHAGAARHLHGGWKGGGGSRSVTRRRVRWSAWLDDGVCIIVVCIRNFMPGGRPIQNRSDVAAPVAEGRHLPRILAAGSHQVEPFHSR